MRKQRPKRPCARAWLYSFEEIVVLASSAKMAPPANVALLRVKLAEATSDMSTCVCVCGGGGEWGGGHVEKDIIMWAGCMWRRVYVGGCMWRRVYNNTHFSHLPCSNQHDSTHTVNMTPHTQST